MSEISLVLVNTKWIIKLLPFLDIEDVDVVGINHRVPTIGV
jgi:hypothetical protein